MDSEPKPVSDDTVNWLVEPDPDNPGVRHFALRDLLGRGEDDPEVRQARADIMCTGPVPAILDAQHPDGYWGKPGGGHSPSYRVTVWQITFLAQLGADPRDKRVGRGCEYYLSHTVAENGAFASTPKPVPSSVAHCLNGDPLHAFLRLGYGGDPRVRAALDWQVRAITGEGEIRYYKSCTCGPGLACAYNGGQPCAWGATKAVKAFGALPPDTHTTSVQRAVEASAEFLLSRDPAVADYPYTERVNAGWFKFGFPLSYRSDILETTEALVSVGYGQDTRLTNVLQFILSKRDDHGRWAMEKPLNGKMWADIEEKGKPSKWVTLRALRVLRGRGA